MCVFLSLCGHFPPLVASQVEIWKSDKSQLNKAMLAVQSDWKHTQGKAFLRGFVSAMAGYIYRKPSGNRSWRRHVSLTLYSSSQTQNKAWKARIYKEIFITIPTWRGALVGHFPDLWFTYGAHLRSRRSGLTSDSNLWWRQNPFCPRWV